MFDDPDKGGFDEQFEDRDDSAGAVEPEPERLGIAWGFIAFLLFATVVAIFIIQNDEAIPVRFLGFEFELNLWILVMSVVLLTLLTDQVLSLVWRRRKRRKIASRTTDS